MSRLRLAWKALRGRSVRGLRFTPLRQGAKVHLEGVLVEVSDSAMVEIADSPLWAADPPRLPDGETRP